MFSANKPQVPDETPQSETLTHFAHQSLNRDFATKILAEFLYTCFFQEKNMFEVAQQLNNPNKFRISLNLNICLFESLAIGGG